MTGSQGFSDTCGHSAWPTQDFLTSWAGMRLVGPAMPHPPCIQPTGSCHPQALRAPRSVHRRAQRCRAAKRALDR